MYKFGPLSDNDVIWVKIQRQFTNLICDLYVTFVYLPPCSSTYGKTHGKEIMQKLEKQVEYFTSKG